jgi:hypothetical protein
VNQSAVLDDALRSPEVCNHVSIHELLNEANYASAGPVARMILITHAGLTAGQKKTRPWASLRRGSVR